MALQLSKGFHTSTTSGGISSIITQPRKLAASWLCRFLVCVMTIWWHKTKATLSVGNAISLNIEMQTFRNPSASLETIPWGGLEAKTLLFPKKDAYNYKLTLLFAMVAVVRLLLVWSVSFKYFNSSRRNCNRTPNTLRHWQTSVLLKWRTSKEPESCK